jgi:hypothetical protein
MSSNTDNQGVLIDPISFDNEKPQKPKPPAGGEEDNVKWDDNNGFWICRTVNKKNKKEWDILEWTGERWDYMGTYGHACYGKFVEKGQVGTITLSADAPVAGSTKTANYETEDNLPSVEKR